MKVSFSGLREVSSSFDYKKMNDRGGSYIPVSLSVRLDNKDGNDLDEFIKVLPKDALPKQKMEQLKKEGILNITSSSVYNEDWSSESKIYLNDFEINDVDVLLKLTELTDKVMERNTNPANNTSFLFSKDAMKMTSGLMNIINKSQGTSVDSTQALKQSVQPQYNKLCANLLKSQLIGAASDFFADVNQFMDTLSGK